MAKVGVIVSVGGQLDIDLKPSHTPGQVFRMVQKEWGLKEEIVDSPFVVIHDKIKNKYRTINTGEKIGEINPEKEVVRVVMPVNGFEED